MSAAATGGSTAAPAAAAGDASGAPPPPTDTLLQYIVLRRDLWGELGWPLGSVVAQGAHAATAALWLSRDDSCTQQYCAPDQLDHMHKVGRAWWCNSVCTKFLHWVRHAGQLGCRRLPALM